MSEKIFVTPVNLPAQFIKTFERQSCFVEINDTYLLASMDYTAEEPVDPDDKDLGLTLKRTCFLITVLRDKISGIEISVTKTNKRWVVAIISTGFAIDTMIFFKDQSEAISLRNKLHQWVVSTTSEIN